MEDKAATLYLVEFRKEPKIVLPTFDRAAKAIAHKIISESILAIGDRARFKNQD